MVTKRTADFGGDRARRSGFTLVELLAVVAIMMLIMAAVTTNIDLLVPATRIEAAARMLSADIASARASAIAQGLPYRIDYNLTNSSYRVATPFRANGGIAIDDEERVFAGTKVFPEGVKIEEITVGTNRITNGTYRIEIRPNGNSVEHVISLKRDIPEARFYLVVQGLTGFVQFFGSDWRPEIVSDSDFP